MLSAAHYPARVAQFGIRALGCGAPVQATSVERQDLPRVPNLLAQEEPASFHGRQKVRRQFPLAVSETPTSTSPTRWEE